MMNAKKERVVGEVYRPKTTILKVKNGEPTKIEIRGLTYALVHDSHINGNKSVHANLAVVH